MTLEDMVAEYEAVCRWHNGEQPSFSTDICENLTCGYGTLDNVKLNGTL